MLIKVAGVTKAQAERVLEPDQESDAADARRRTRRKWRLNPDDLPAGVLATLRRDRYFETTLSQVRNFIRNKRTGSAF